MLEDSEFEQGLEMLTVARAFSYISLLRIAGAPWAQLPTSLQSGRFLQVNPAGIRSILGAQHVSGIGSSCRSSSGF